MVIASFRSTEDKKKVMSEKSYLKENRHFQNVYIQHDESREQRLMSNNFRTMLNALSNNDTDWSLRGSRIVRGSQNGIRDLTPKKSFEDGIPNRTLLGHTLQLLTNVDRGIAVTVEVGVMIEVVVEAVEGGGGGYRGRNHH